jgi:hypothetical protein
MSGGVDRDVKRFAFVVGGVLACLHLVGGLLLLTTGDWAAIGAALFLDAAGLLIGGLWAAARKVFPDGPGGRS